MYKSRPISQVIHENINYILDREKLNRQFLRDKIGNQKIIHDPNANVTSEKLELIAKTLGTNIPDLVTDWKDGSYPDEHEEYDHGCKDGYMDCLKGKRLKIK